MSPFNRKIVAVVFALALVGSAALAMRSSTAPAAAADDKPAAKFEVYKDRAGEFRWRLRATNTQILATSGDAYKAKRDCLHAIESVKQAVANAPVEELPDRPARQNTQPNAGESDTPAEGKSPAR